MEVLGLSRVTSFTLPTDVVVETIRFLRRVGRDQCEGFVVWAGKYKSDSHFQFTRALFPKQRASSSRDGLLVIVTGEALFELNKDLFAAGEILGAQVHSHPTEAYHSSTDDSIPIATLVGALSVVIPFFARHAPEDIDEWAWYRLVSYGVWEPLDDTVLVSVE